MAFNLTKFLKGLLISESGTNTPKEIQITPGGTTGTKTTITSSQTTNKTITLPDATDTLVGKNTTDTLANKTLTSPILNNAEINVLLAAEQGSNPSIPAAGYRKFYAKAGGFYDLNSAGVSTLLSAGGGGGGSPLTVQDEGTTLSTATTKINFIGAGVTVTQPVANEINVTIPGGSGGADTRLSNLDTINPTSIPTSLLPSVQNAFDIGSFGAKWRNLIALGIVTGGDIRAFYNTSYIQLLAGPGQQTPSGIPVAYTLVPQGNGESFGISSLTDPFGNNANSTGTINIETGNKILGTGNSGNVTIQTGTSAGGTRGKVILNGSEIDATSKKITNVATPTVGTDAANMAYVLANAGGGPINIVQSPSSGTFTTTNPSNTPVTNLSVTITVAAGATVELSLQSASGSGTIFGQGVNITSNSNAPTGHLTFVKNGTQVNTSKIGISSTAISTNSQIFLPASAFSYKDIGVTAGTYTYSVQVSSSFTVNIESIKLVTYELK